MPKSSKKEQNKNPDGFVRVEDCRERHESARAELSLVKNALFGSDGRGGIVKDIGDIKTDVKILREGFKGRLSGRDKAAIVSAVTLALASVVAAVLALLK